MSTLKEVFAAQVPALREEVKQINTQYGDKVISEVNVGQAYGGMRGIIAMICDTSVVDSDTGLIIRGRPILDLTDKWPEEIFWLLLTGNLPTAEETTGLRNELMARSNVPDYVWAVLEALPEDSHPMTMLNTAILALQHDSLFAHRYPVMNKTQYWEAAYEDALSLLGMIPVIAAGVYRLRYKKGARLVPDRSLDWAANYVHLLGLNDQTEECRNMMRLYLTLHCDHEGGNVSALTCHTVGSALSDPYLAVSAGLNGLAGPLHGLANQECLAFVLQLHERFKGVPTHDQVREVCWELLNSGQVIPGYGHAVLRAEDPRFTAFYQFGKKYCDGEVFKTMQVLYETAPEVLKEQGKAKNPWPNVDAGSGALLYHYGLLETGYYTVLFSVSRAMGLLSQLIVNRAIGTPITRPKSVSTEWIKSQVGASAAG